MSLLSVPIKGIAQCQASLHSSYHGKGKTILHKLLIYYKHMCLCRVSTFFGIKYCFPSVIKTLLQGFHPYTCITFYLCCKCSMFPVLIIMQRSVALRSALFYVCGKKKHLWIIFSFNHWVNCYIYLIHFIPVRWLLFSCVFNIPENKLEIADN